MLDVLQSIDITYKEAKVYIQWLIINKNTVQRFFLLNYAKLNVSG